MQPGLEQAWDRIRNSFRGPLLFNLVSVILLMMINWGIEAVKWRLSVKPIQSVSYPRALMAVLSGVSFSVTTPNRMGEYLGRLLYMNEGNRLRTISITIVGSISQLIITIWAGVIGLLVLKQSIIQHQLISSIWLNMILYGVGVTGILLTLFYFRLSVLIRWVDRLPGSKRFAYLVEALEEFHPGLLLRLLLLSGLRFAVFLLQYYLMFELFDVHLGIGPMCWSVSVAFLVMAAVPTIAVAELAQRGAIVTTIVGIFSTNNLGMTFATAGIWFINLIIPAIIGSLLILRMRKIVKTG